jgi:hypothetical protein
MVAEWQVAIVNFSDLNDRTQGLHTDLYAMHMELVGEVVIIV